MPPKTGTKRQLQASDSKENKRPHLEIAVLMPDAASEDSIPNFRTAGNNEPPGEPSITAPDTTPSGRRSPFASDSIPLSDSLNGPASLHLDAVGATPSALSTTPVVPDGQHALVSAADIAASHAAVTLPSGSTTTAAVVAGNGVGASTLTESAVVPPVGSGPSGLTVAAAQLAPATVAPSAPVAPTSLHPPPVIIAGDHDLLAAATPPSDSQELDGSPPVHGNGTGTVVNTGPSANADNNSVITTRTRSYFEPELTNRLNSLNGYLNLGTGCATLHTLPFNKLGWGFAAAGHNNKQDHMYLNGQLLTVWVLGEVGFRNFVSKGRNVRRPSVLIRPLLADDLANANRLLNSWCRPVKGNADTSGNDGIWLSKWSAEPSVPLFDRMFDALDTYKRKSLMPQMSATDLKVGDIVLAEFFVTRWIPKDDTASNSTSGSKSTKSKREWRKWNVDFRLDAISLLYPGSDYYVEETKADEDFEA